MQETILSPEAAEQRLIRRSDYVSCSVAFIDCKTPGSHLKQNYSMIGPGVTTSADQVINLKEMHGFNIGAAAMPHGITNNLHIHFTAEIFMVFKGTWKFRWGPNGDDGEIIGEAGDIASIPTWIFRGFTNVGVDDGWIFTCLGGDDTGGIIWHPTILNGAAQYGLYLTKENLLIDTTKGAKKPEDSELMRAIQPDEIARLRRYSVADMRQRVVTRAERQWSGEALLDSCLPSHHSQMAPVIGYGLSQDRNQQPKITNPHGFTMEWLKLAPGQSVSRFRISDKMVLINYGGNAELVLNEGAAQTSLEIHAWDQVSVPANVWRAVRNVGDTDLELLVICAGDHPKHPEWTSEVVAAARSYGRATDKSGFIAPAHLLPGYALGKN